MKRSVSLLFWVILSTLVVRSAPITSSQAASKAQAFLSSHGKGGMQPLSLVGQGSRKAIGRGGAVPNPSYYVFNQGEDQGFVIVAGDDCAEGILGYADKGHFDLEKIPDNLRAWLDGYAEEIAWAQQQPSYAKKRNVMAAESPVGISRMVVAPLLESTWGQDNPYNKKCLTQGGSKAVTGCVATALAQIMYYHKWPQDATDTIPAYNPNQMYAGYQALLPITFEWGKMQPHYDVKDDTDSPASQAVADLMLYCGHAVEMQYGVTSSGADAMDCAAALNDYFGYGNPTKTASRSSFTAEEWDEMVYAELAEGRPVLYAAAASNGSGHAFVCDGYDGEGLFHINWGWNGQSDGYFRLQALNPASQGTGGSGMSSGFSLRQMMVFGISPEVLTSQPAVDRPALVQVVELTLSGDVSELDYGNPSTTDFSSVKVDNVFRVPFAGIYAVGFALCKGDEILQVRNTAAGNLLSTYDMRFTNPVSLSGLGRNLEDGEYQIRCVCRPGDAEEWLFDTDSERIFIAVTIADGKATFVEQTLGTTLEVTHVEQAFDNSTKKQVRATVVNRGPYDFYGLVQLRIDGTVMCTENLQLSVEQQDYVDFMFATDSNPVRLNIVSEETGEVLYENESFTFVDPPATTSPEVEAYGVRSLDEENKKHFGNVAEGAVTLRNAAEESWTGNVTLQVKVLTEGSEEGQYTYTTKSSSQRVTLQSGETREVVVSCPGLSYGKEVWFNLSVGSWSAVVGSMTEPYVVTAGYEEWDAQGNRSAMELTATTTVSSSAVAARFCGLDLTDVTIIPNSNPNTLYFLDEDATIPSTLETKNVVKGYKAAGDIVWNQGFGFYVPTSFEVSGQIKYVRTPQAECDEYKGWETVCLPFAVKAVYVEDERVHWSGVEEDGFWVMRLQGVDGDQLDCSLVKEWKANEPYIIGVPASMKEKPMTLSASDVRILKTTKMAKVVDGYQIEATTADTTLPSAYVMNAEGDAFQLTRNVEVKAGEVFMLDKTGGADAPERLLITRRMGDVNHDGVVNVTDVLLTVSNIKGEDVDVFYEANADLNGDGLITVTDVMRIIEIEME